MMERGTSPQSAVRRRGPGRELWHIHPLEVH
jgi:hypothetical protein